VIKEEGGKALRQNLLKGRLKSRVRGKKKGSGGGEKKGGDVEDGPAFRSRGGSVREELHVVTRTTLFKKEKGESGGGFEVAQVGFARGGKDGTPSGPKGGRVPAFRAERLGGEREATRCARGGGFQKKKKKKKKKSVRGFTGSEKFHKKKN